MFDRFQSIVTRAALIGVVATSGLGLASEAMARDSEDCMLQWHRAVASYLTQNRTSFPQDEKMTLFEPACKIEQSGDKRGARIEAIMIGVQQLAKLDPRGCARFMEYYVGSDKGGEVCDSADTSADKLREMIAQSVPEKH